MALLSTPEYPLNVTRAKPSEGRLYAERRHPPSIMAGAALTTREGFPTHLTAAAAAAATATTATATTEHHTWAARLPDVYRDFTIFINLNTF